MRKMTTSGTPTSTPKSVQYLVLGVASITIFFRTDVADPFNSVKLILLLLISGWLIGLLIVSYKKSPIKLKSKDASVLILISIFVTSLLISTLATDVKLVGFIGDTQRKNGFLSYFCLTILMLFAARSITFQNVVTVFKTGIYTSLILGVYGIIQITGNDFVKWVNPYNSMISTVGNPNFASAILAVLTLLSIFGLSIENFSKFYKTLIIVSISVSIFCIVESDSRQGLLVIFFGLLFYLSALSYVKLRKLGLAIIFISVISSIAAIMGMLQKGPLASLLYKDSVSVRGYYWQAGFKMFKENIFTGVGVDRYGAYFKEFREVSYPLKYGYEIGSSNAHNLIIQLFSTAGLLVGLSYMALLGYVFFVGLKLIKNTVGNNQKIAISLIAAWLGFQSQTIISIDNIGVSVWGWLFGGAILGLSNVIDSKSKEDFNSKQNKRYSINLNYHQILLSLFFVVLASIPASMIYSAERDMYNLRNSADPNYPSQKNVVFGYTTRLFNNPFADHSYKIEAASSSYEMGYRDEVFSWVDQLLKQDPRNLDFLRAKAFLSESIGDIDLAIKNREVIAEYDPWNFPNIIELAKLYAKINMTQESNRLYREVITYAPNTAVAKTASELLAKP